VVDICRAEHSEEKKLSSSLVEFKTRLQWTLFSAMQYRQLASQIGFEEVHAEDWSPRVGESLGAEAGTIEEMKEQILSEYGPELFTSTSVEWENMRKWLREGDLRVYVLGARKPAAPP